MPKIIKNVEEKIFTTVIELIDKDGFSDTSMKKIAENTDLAVGTLYNYFDNKEELIFYVITKSWEDTFSKLEQILKKDFKQEEKIEKFILLLYREISQRKAVGKELIKNNIIAQERFESINEQLKQQFITLFDISETDRKQFVADLEVCRIIDTLMMTIIKLASEYPEQEQENIQFLKQLTEKLLS